MWQIRMLGRLEVISPDGRPITFRSRKVGSLLAFLALNEGREVANATLQDLLWPDADGDRQSQSLRRAVADLRDALEFDGASRGTVQTGHGKVCLNLEAFEADTQTFLSLASEGASSGGTDVRAAAAVALYGGPLLAPLEDDWVHAYRRQFEEAYCRVVELLCRSLTLKGEGREAVRIASTALVNAPQREEIHIALIRGYASLGNRSMALQHFEDLERMLDDDYGQSPSEEAMAALDFEATSAEGQRADETRPSSLSPPIESGGGMEAESIYYVERDSDQAVRAALRTGEAVVLIFGPRQVGKTSLLAKTMGVHRKLRNHVVLTDFQALSKAEIERPTTLYRALVHGFASQLGLSYEPSWNEWIGPNSNLDNLIDALLRQTNEPVCWAMDEVDRLFGTDFADDFFGLVRSWHNRRALDPDGPWRRLSLLIGYATEAHLFIRDVNQSPFNVGVRINLADFTPEQVAELGSRYPGDLRDCAEAVFAVTRGHPFLTRRAFAYLQGGGSLEAMTSQAAEDSGPFGDHLKSLRASIQRSPIAEDAVKQILSGKAMSDKGLVARLQSAGLLSPAAAGFRVPAYETYLRASLST